MIEFRFKTQRQKQKALSEIEVIKVPLVDRENCNQGNVESLKNTFKDCPMEIQKSFV